MPRVPSYQPNQVGPVNPVRERFRAADNNGGAFGGLAAGLQGVGQEMAHTAIEQDRVNAQFDEQQARQAALEFKAAADPIVSGFGNLAGKNAVDTGSATQGQITALRDETLNKAANPRQRRFMEMLIQPAASDYLGAVGNHSARQQQVMSIGTAKSEADMSASHAAAAYQNPEKSAQYRSEANAALARLGALQGWSEETLKAETFKLGSGIHSSVISQNLASDDVDMAAVYFDAHRDEMTPEGILEASRQLKGPLELRLADSDVARAVGAIPATGEPAVTASASSASRMHAITAQSESGTRDRDANGRLITSPAGAQGMMQVMPATARDPGHGIRPWDGKSDEDRNRVGRELLDALMKKYADPEKAWAAYNWGEGRVDKAVAAHGGDWLSTAPKETRDYVQKNIAALGSDGHIAARSQRWDKEQTYNQIDALAEKEGWSFERRERARNRADQMISADEELQARKEAEADRDASEFVLAKGASFTDTGQIPGAIWNSLSSTDKARYQAAAERNRAPKDPPANGAAAMTLNQMRFYEPEQFKALNLGQYVGQMTRAELDTLSTQQAQMRTAAPAGWSPRQGIVTAVSFGKRIGGLDLKPEDETAIMQIMEAEANAMYQAGGKKPLSEAQYQDLFRSATRGVTLQNSFLGVRTSTSETPRYKLDESNMPASTRERITAALRKELGREPTDEQVLTAYRIQTRR